MSETPSVADVYRIVMGDEVSREQFVASLIADGYDAADAEAQATEYYGPG
jgi:hypothetical protein